MKILEKKLTIKDFEAKKPGWCPGCGDFGVYAALRNAFVQLGLTPEKIVLVGGIGCSGKISDYIKTNSVHTLHGRVLPVATGIKLSNPSLTVIGAGGDGDAFAIGMSHLIHTCRRNPNITYIVMDNQVYGLTKGQVSPTSIVGMTSPSTPYGSVEEPIDGVSIAISAGATFVARGFSGDPKKLAELFVRGIQHNGFSFIDVISPCVTFNRLNTYDWFRKRIVPFESNSQDLTREKVLNELGLLKARGKIPVGVFFVEDRPALEDEVLADPSDPIALRDLTKVPEGFWDLLNTYR